MDLKEEWTIHNEQVYQWTIVPMATWNFFAEVVSSLNNSVCGGATVENTGLCAQLRGLPQRSFGHCREQDAR